MIRQIHNKNALLRKVDVLAHQTNYYGIMGGGIAYQIRENILSKEEFKLYVDLCNKEHSKLLGQIQILNSISPNKKIANLFGQYEFNTDYDALTSCMKKLEEYVLTKTENHTVAVPGYIGCGIAGGDWNIVKNDIIFPIFKDSEVKMDIVYL